MYWSYAPFFGVTYYYKKGLDYYKNWLLDIHVSMISNFKIDFHAHELYIFFSFAFFYHLCHVLTMNL